MQLDELSPEERELVEKHRKKKAKEWKPVEIGLISAPNKEAAFDRLYELACEMWNYRKEHGYKMKDEEHWCYEAVMELLDIEKKDEDPDIWHRLRGDV